MVLLAGVPFAFTPPAAANAVSAYGCTIDPEKPKLNDGKLAAKARIQCGLSWNGRAIRTELQQRRADGSYYTVAKSILVRYVPGVMTGQWYGAGSEWVGGCNRVSGTRKYRSVIMITDAAGNVQETASNPEEFDRDCVDAGVPPRVGLLFASNLIDDCAIATEVLTDPDAAFTDPEVLFEQGNVDPCGENGVAITSMITNQADADWSMAVEGIEPGLPSSQQARSGAIAADVISLPDGNSQALAAMTAKEEEIGDLFAPEELDEEESAEDASAAQGNQCQEGRIGDRMSHVLRKRNRGYGNILLFSTIRIRRISCTEWQIIDVKTVLKRGTRPVRLDDASYPMTKQPDPTPIETWIPRSHDFDCQLMELHEPFGWPDSAKWIIRPNKKFTVGGQIESLEWYLYDPWCVTQGGVHLVGEQKLVAPKR